MPSDPTFETREAIEAWRRRERKIEIANDLAGATLAAAEIDSTVRRVTLAHAYLLEENDD